MRVAAVMSAALAGPACAQTKPSADDFWNAMMDMFEGGPRLTGSAGHKQFLDNVEDSLSNVGFEMHRDVMQFKRWEATNYSLVVHMDEGDVEIPVGYPFVRSGLTGAEGVTLPFGNALTVSPHIAITSAPMTALGPVGCDLQTITLEPSAKAAVCCVSQESVRLDGEYQPFTNPSLKPGLPTLMVAEENCDLIKSISGKLKTKATLKLIGTQDPDETAHIWGILPGQTDDIIMMGIHSDGQNAVEENGIPALVTMAKYLASLPLEQRKYSLGFAAVSGHMDYDVPHPETQGFAKMHKDDIMKKVKACVAPEHFGTMQWKMDGDEYKPTGKSVQYTGFGSSLKLRKQVANAFKDNNLDNHVVLTGPIPEEAGSALGWSLHGCPTVGGISLPDYLVNLHHGGPDKLDKDRYFATASAYMQVIEELLSDSEAPTHAPTPPQQEATLSFTDGPYQTATKTVHVNGTRCVDNAKAIITYPTDSSQKYPVLSFAHGVFSNIGNDYTGTLNGVASRGFVIIAMQDCAVALQEFRDQVRMLDYMLNEEQELRPILNLDSPTGVFGHSMGGAATINAASDHASIEKTRIGAAAAMHPGIQLGNLNPQVPTIYFTGSVDPLCGPLVTKPQYDLAALHNVSRAYAVMKGYDHLRVMGKRSNGEVDHIADWFECYLSKDQAKCDKIFGREEGSLCVNEDYPKTKCLTVVGEQGPPFEAHGVVV